MALADIQRYGNRAFGYQGDEPFKVQAGGTPPAINAGEPVVRALGASTYVTPMATAKPVVGTDYMVGIAATTSTETISVDGFVNVTPILDGESYLIAPKVPATFGVGSTPSQATYDALIGSRVTIDLTAGVYTLNSTDNAANGCVVLPLDVSKFFGKVRIGFRQGTFFLN